jgi:ribosomal-protein-alanine N-acetyltransferase
MIALETGRLFLRNFFPSDWEALQAMIVQYQVSEMAAYDQPWPTAAEEIKGVTNWFSSGDQYHAVCQKEGGQFIGFVALNPESDEDSRVFNLGYVFNADFHGNGYATEACRAVLQNAFEKLGVERVVTGTAAANHPSRRLLERLGFQKTKESIASFYSTEDGKPIEFLGTEYSINKETWMKREAKDPPSP